MRKIMILFLLSVFLMPFVFANTEFIEWGFGNRIIGIAERNQFWGSTLPLGSLPVQNVSISVAIIDLPTVVDLDDDGINEVIFYTSTGVQMYDNNGNFLSSYNSPTVLHRGTIASQNGTENDIFLLVDKSGDDIIDIIKKTGSSLVRKDRFNITDRVYSGFIYANRYIYVPDMSMNITRFYILNGTEIDTIDSDDGSVLHGAGATTDANMTFFNPMTVGDFNNDGFDEIGFIYLRGTTSKFSIYDYSSSSFLLFNQSIIGAAAQVQVASVGSQSSVPSFIIEGKSGGQHNLYVYSISGNLLFSDVDAAGLGGTAGVIVNDVNSDGLNELCWNHASTSEVQCFDSTFTLIKTIPTFGTGQPFGHTSSGSYGSSYVDFLSTTGIFRQNATNLTLTPYKVYGMPADTIYTIPVVIKDKSNFVKDILAVGKLSTTIMFSSQLNATCGNDFCDGGENQLSCPADCGLSEPTQAVLTSVMINPCNTQQWMINTTVKVTAKAETIDNSKVQMTAIIYDGTPYIQIAQTSFLPSGSTTSLFFIANQTCSGCSISISASSENNAEPTTLLFPFTVSSFGVNYPASECGTTQALEQVVSGLNDTSISGNKENNAIKTAIDGISSTQFGIGYLGIWLVLMLVVAVAVIIICAVQKWSGAIVMALVAIAEIFMMILGTIIGFIPIGVIIVLIVLSLGLIVLIARNAATGA